MSINNNFYLGVQETLKDIEFIYNIRADYDPTKFGLYLTTYLKDNELEVRDIPLNNLVGIQEVEKESMYRFGYTLNGHKSDDYLKNSDAFFVTFNSENEEYIDELAIALSDVLFNKSNHNFNNYIILIDEGSEDLVCYDEELIDVLNDFKSQFKIPKNVHVLEYNGIIDYTSSEHKTRCLIRNYKDISYLAEDMTKALEINDVKGEDVIFTKEASDKLKDKEIFMLAYIALRNKLNIIFEDISFQHRFITYCKFLFSGKYLPINKFIQMHNTTTKSLAILAGRNGHVEVVTSGFDTHYEVKCLPVDSVINSQNIETLSIMLEPSLVTINIDRTYGIEDIIKTFAPKFLELNKNQPYGCKELTTAKISLLEKFQKVAMRVLYDNPVSVKELIFFPHEGQIYFSCISFLDFNLEEYPVVTMTESDDTPTVKVDINDILPTQLFLTDRRSETKYLFPSYTLTELNAIWDNMNHDENKVIYYISQDMLKEAILAQEIMVTNRDRKFYKHCKSIDIEFCKNILINLAGRVEQRLVASP